MLLLKKVFLLPFNFALPLEDLPILPLLKRVGMQPQVYGWLLKLYSAILREKTSFVKLFRFLQSSRGLDSLCLN